MARVFLDTNVLVYRLDSGDPDKQERAEVALINSRHTFVVSTQVLLELYSVLTRRLVPPREAAQARGVIQQLTTLEVVPADAQLVVSALETAGAHRLSVWDAMILEAAVAARCEELWTEDLAGGSTLRGVRLINPLVEDR